MKNRILIFLTVCTILSLTAFAFVNRTPERAGGTILSCKTTIDRPSVQLSSFIPDPDVELSFDVGSRFMSNITREQLKKARSIYDFISAEEGSLIVSSVSVTKLDDDISETGVSADLTSAQLELLRSLPYSANLLVRAEFQEQITLTGQLIDNIITPHFTVVPEMQATYTLGKEALINYIKENTKGFAAIVKKDELRPGRVTFTISKYGTVTDASVTSSSGYPALDKKVADLITTMPGIWLPASNGEGENIEQKFVFFYGMIGC